MHRSKGLEFPVVYAPFLWDQLRARAPRPAAPARRRGDAGARRRRHGRGGVRRAPRRLHVAEDAGESLRLAYVALTRARCQVVAHWAPTGNTARRAAAPAAVRRPGGEQGQVPDWATVGDDGSVRRRLDDLAARSGGTIAVERRPSARPGASWQQPVTADPRAGRAAVRPRPSTRPGCARRTPGSPPGCTTRRRSAGWPARPSGRGRSTSRRREGVVPTGSTTRERSARGAGPAVADGRPAEGRGVRHPGARGAGEHRLHRAGPARASWCGSARPRAPRATPASRPPSWPTRCCPSLLTPLGPLAGGLRLADVARADRLDELDFELPLPAATTPTGEAHASAQIAGLLRRHLPADDPLRGYADDLATPLLGRPVAARLPRRQHRPGAAGPRREGTPRYLVVDYKTNWLGAGETLTAARLHARRRWPRRCATAHYPLQALLYSVALHRLPALAAAGLRPRRPPRRRALPLPARHVRTGRRRWSTRCRAASSPGRRPPRWSPTSPTSWTEVRHDRPSPWPRARPLRSPAGTTARPDCSPTSTASACSVPPTCTSPPGSAASAGETDERVLLAVALTVRALRHGSVCLELATVAQVTAVEGVDRAVVAALPWPEPTAWPPPWRRARWWRWVPTVAADRPLRLVGGLLYLDRYWRQERCIADDARPRRPRRRRRRSTRPAARTPSPGCSRPRTRTGSGWRPWWRRTAGSACSPADPAPARPPPSPKLLALLAGPGRRPAAGGAGRADRQGRGPADRGGDGRGVAAATPATGTGSAP